jgi:hypothetical protein
MKQPVLKYPLAAHPVLNYGIERSVVSVPYKSAAIPNRPLVRIPSRIPADTEPQSLGKWAGIGHIKPSRGWPD